MRTEPAVSLQGWTLEWMAVAFDRLKREDFRFAYMIASRYNTLLGEAFEASHAEMAAAADCSKRTAEYSVARIEDAGLLRVVGERSGGRNRPNTYMLTLPSHGSSSSEFPEPARQTEGAVA